MNFFLLSCLLIFVDIQLATAKSKKVRCLSRSVAIQEIVNAYVGEPVSFNCSARTGIPYNGSVNSTYTIHLPRGIKDFVHVNSTEYRSNQTGCEELTTVFTIPKVKDDDFNLAFSCILEKIKQSDENNKYSNHIRLIKRVRNIPFYVGILIAIALILTSIVAAVVIYIYRLELRLIYKDKFGNVEIEGRYDVYICYNQDDNGHFVNNFILPFLESKLCYTCYDFNRNCKGGTVSTDAIAKKIEESRRFLLIMSDKVNSDPDCILACYIAVREALGPRHLKIICIFPPDMRMENNGLTQTRSHSEKICSSYKYKRVNRVEPGESSQNKIEKFWKQIRLQLPPQRCVDTRV